MALIQAVLRGLAAGFIGTVVLTLTETLEIAVTGREPSTVPGQVGAKLAGLDPADDPHLERRSTAVHWMHGIAMGPVRGLLAVTGLGKVGGSIVFYAIVWGGDALLYRLLGIAPVPWRWKRAELATDLSHKGVYAAATSVAYVLSAR